jgi:nucleoside-triphosphatase
LKEKGYKLGGMTSQEVRKGGIRVGFEITDFDSKKKGWLAHVNQPSGPQIGKYRVNLKDLDEIGANSILNAIKNADIIVIDEIGPMELFSQNFKEAVTQAIDSQKPVIGTIHSKASNPLIRKIKTHEDAEILEVTYQNRATLPHIIVEKVLQLIQKLS